MPTRLPLALLLLALTACTEGALPVNVGKGPPMADATRSSVVVTPPRRVADGQEKATVTVTVLDKDGMPIEGMEVALSATGEANTLEQPPKTDANGVAVGTLASTRAETKDLTVRAGPAPWAVELGQHPQVQFVPGAPSRLTFLSQPASTSAEQGLAQVQVAVEDAHGNRVTSPVNVAMELQGGTTGAVLGGTTSHDSDSGVAGFSGLFVRRAGTGYTLRATAPGVPESVSNTFDIAAGPVATTTLEADSDNVTADGQAFTTVTFTALDAFGNPVTGRTVDLAVSGISNTLEPASSGSTGADGRFVATLKSTRAELKTVNSTLDGAVLPTASQVTFIPGPATRLAFLTQPPASLTADQGLPELQVTALDAHGNVATRVVRVTLALEGGTAGAVLNGTGARNTSGGVAGFNDLFVRRAGIDYTLRATSAGLQDAVSNAFTVTAGAVASTTVTAGPDNVVANGSDTTTLTVAVHDAFGNPVAGRAVGLSVSGTNNTVEPASSGSTGADGRFIATLKSTRAQRKTVSATLDGTPLVQQPEVTFIPGPPSYLAFLSQPPASLPADQGLPEIRVTALDAHGNTTTQVVPVTLALEGGTAGAVLGGTVARDTSGGVAGFSGLFVRRAGIDYRLRATSGVLQDAVSDAFTITSAAPDATAATVTASPDNVVANGSDTTTLTVTVRDTFGNPVAGRAVGLAVSGTNNTVEPASSGSTGADGRFVATLKSTRAQRKTVSATLDGAPLTQQPEVTFIPGPPSRLAFLSQPPASLSADQGLPELRVTTLDAQGNTTTGVAPVTLTLQGGTAGAVLGGTATRNTSGGVAGFDDLFVRRSGINYTLRATSGVLQAAVSNAFTITSAAPDATAATVTASPDNVVANGSDTTTLTVTVRDTFGNPVAARAVSLSVSGIRNTVEPASSGSTGADGRFVATLKSTRAEGKTVSASLDGAALPTTAQVTFIPGPPSRLAFVTQPPASTVADVVFAPSVQVEVLDAHGNRVLASPPEVTLAVSLIGVTLEGTTQRASPLGLASFDDLHIKKAGTNYELVATAPSLQAARSSPFSIIAAAPSTTTSTFTATPDPLQASTTETADLHVTVLDAFNNPVAGRGVTLAVTSGSAHQLSPTSGNTDANGRFVATYKSIKAELKNFRATVTGLASPLTTSLTVKPAPLETVTLLANPNKLDADGTTPVNLLVTAVDIFGNPIRDLPVTLSATGTGNVIDPASGTTDVSGTFTSALRSTAYGEKTVTASVTEAASSRTRVDFRTVTFLLPTATVSDLNVPGQKEGCVALEYTVKHSKGARTDLTVQYEAAPSTWRRATQAGGTSPTSTGVTGVATSSAGLTHRFLWNSTADLPAAHTTTRLRIVTSLPGAPSEVSSPVSVALTNGSRFDAAQRYSAGVAPQALAVVDLDRDGKQDAITINPTGNVFTVLKGDGAGAFTFLANSTAGTGSNLLLVVDVNRDGRPDVVTTGGGTQLLVTLNTAAGASIALTPQAAVPLTSTPVGLTSGDFNRDGKVDLALAMENGSVAVLTGTGLGGFSAWASVTNVGTSLRQLAAGDFNRDGLLDLAVADEQATTGGVHVLIGTSTGFGARSRLETGDGTSALQVEDLDADSKLDLLVASRSAGTLLLARGNGDDTFTLGLPVTLGAGAQPSNLAIKDVDGDGKRDVLVAGVGQDVLVLKGLGSGALAEPLAVAAGGTTAAVGAADLDGDGRLDLLATRPGDGGLVRMLSTQAARCESALGAPQQLQTGAKPSAVALVDFDGDARVDMAVTSTNTNTVSVARGLGNGKFGAWTQLALGTGATGPQGVAAGDFDGDGLVDLATANTTSSSVSLLFNNGTGGFEPATPVGLGASVRPTGLATGDFDGDGKFDLVVANNSSNTALVLFGRADRTVLRTQSVSVGSGPNAVVVADFNGDGRQDFATANTAVNTVTVRLGDGAGNFDASLLPASVGTSPRALSVGYLNKDEVLDLAVANAGITDGNSAVTILFGQGDGTFVLGSTPSVGPRPLGLVLGDFDLDDDLDLATASNTTTGISVLTNDGHGSFSPLTSIAAGSGLTALRGADLDGDGRTDLVAAIGGGESPVTTDNRVSIVRSAESGFGGAALLTTTTATATLLGGVSADVNSDGLPDVLMAARNSGRLAVWNSVGPGSFQSGGAVYSVGGNPLAVAVGDVDRNGTPDALVANQLNNSVSVLSGDGNGGFVVTSAPTVAQQPFALALEDLDSDGDLDLVTVSPTANNIAVNLNTGAGTFGGPATYSVGMAPSDAMFADFNGDGRRDVVVTALYTGQVNVMLANGTGGFAAARVTPLALPSGTTSDKLAVADLDRDGRMDVVVSLKNTTTPSVLTLRGDGTGLFTTVAQVTLPVQPKALALADMDGDALLDLVLTGDQGLGSAPPANSLIVLRGNAQGAFSGPQSWALNASPTSIGVADLNLDGMPDLFTGGSGGASVVFSR